MSEPQGPPLRDEPLRPGAKFVYGTGDFTVNLVLSAASLLYFLFLTQQAGLSPALAGFVVLAARAVDAFSDPAMGRISDRTRWRVGRRRGYFLLGALPFGACFALMWVVVPFESEGLRFVYYTAVYVGVSLAMTVLSVPYLALLPEMAEDYDERTSLNTYRNALAVMGTFAAVGMNAFALHLGDDAAAWRRAGIVFAVVCVLPWLGVFRVSFERSDFQRDSAMGFVEGARVALAHPAFRSLTALYIFGRVSIDLIALLLKIFFVYWIGRAGDFDITMTVFLLTVVASLPFWLRFAHRHDKRNVFIIGAAWWGTTQLLFYAVQPDWPGWVMFVLAPLAAIGFAVADLMPWAMLGEVVDEDELRTGERREGVYVGFFMFLRKLGGALAVWLVGITLDVVGYDGTLPREQQPELAIQTIRVLAAFAPPFFLALAIKVAMGYSLTRARHQQILDELSKR